MHGVPAWNRCGALVGMLSFFMVVCFHRIAAVREARLRCSRGVGDGGGHGAAFSVLPSLTNQAHHSLACPHLGMKSWFLYILNHLSYIESCNNAFMLKNKADFNISLLLGISVGVSPCTPLVSLLRQLGVNKAIMLLGCLALGH